MQKYACKAVANGLATVGLTTEVKGLPDAAAEKLLPLLPLMPQGDIYFDAANGRLRAVRYQLRQELAEHRGEGSKYQFQSTYSEDLVEAK